MDLTSKTAQGDAIHRAKVRGSSRIPPILTAILGLGMLSGVLLLGIYAVSVRQTLHQLLAQQAVTRAELAIVSSHLRLEELMAGRSVDVDREVIAPLDRALGLLQRLLWGGDLEHGGTLRRLSDPELRRRIETARDRLTAFRNRCAERAFEDGGALPAGAGSERSHQDAFDALLAETGALRLELEARWSRSQIRSSRLLEGLIVVSAVLLGAVSFGFWSHLRQVRWHARLPRRATESAGTAAEADPPVRRPKDRGELPARILLVEDNLATRASTRDLLEALGHEVVVAADGEEALRLAAGVEVDLVITDTVMPGMSGHDLVARLREGRPGLRCLLISGHADPVAPEHKLAEERMDFLPKPFDADSLSRKIGRLLRTS